MIPVVGQAEVIPGLVGLACLGFYVVLFIIWIILAVWVYKDAKARGENAVLWLLIVLITGIIGLIIWLIVRPKEKKEERYAPPPPPPPS